MIVDTEEDRVAVFQKLGEAYFIPPWQVPKEFSIPQQYGFYAREPEPDKMKPEDHQTLVRRANRIRRKKGLPPVPGSTFDD